MRQVVFILLFLTSCFRGGDSAVVHGLSPQKQKQKIAHLQKKLILAEKEQKKVEDEVEKISSEIAKVQLALIRRQIDEYERSEKKEPNLFLDERELLYQMIQKGPSPSAFEAQVELDRILRMITELSDEGKNDISQYYSIP